VTVAPGITPPNGSLTVPDTVPLVICAEAGTAMVRVTIHDTIRRLDKLLTGSLPGARQ